MLDNSLEPIPSQPLNTEIYTPIPLESPEEIDPVVMVSAKRNGLVSIPLKTIVPSEEQTLAQLIDNANKENNLNMQILIENLSGIERNLSRAVETTPAESAKHMQSLYRVLTQAINADKTHQQFKQEWSLIVKLFKEKENGGFSGARLYRGVAFWALGHDEYKHYQSLMNLIEASNRWGTQEMKKYVNLTSCVVHPISEAGRGRLLSYYA